MVADLLSFSEQLGRDGVDRCCCRRGGSAEVSNTPAENAVCPAPTLAGDPAGPAQAAQHGGSVPAADVRRAAAAPHAADGSPAAAAPQQRPAPEPGGCAAGKNEGRASCRNKRQSGYSARAPCPLSLDAHKCRCVCHRHPLTDEERGAGRPSTWPTVTQHKRGEAGAPSLHSPKRRTGGLPCHVPAPQGWGLGSGRPTRKGHCACLSAISG